MGQDAIVASPQRSLLLHDLSDLASRFPTSLEGSKVALKCGDPVDFVAALCALDGKVASMLFVANDLPEATTDLLLAEGGYDRLIEDIAWLEPLASPSKARVAATSWNLTLHPENPVLVRPLCLYCSAEDANHFEHIKV